MAIAQSETRTKRKPRLFTAAVAAAVVVGGSLLARWWLEREQMSLEFFWGSGAPISSNLFQFAWGEDFSIPYEDNPNKPGPEVLATFRLWYIGPFGVRQIIYPQYERE
jgi:hypothetical protein